MLYNLFDFVMFLIINKIWQGRWEVLAVYFIFLVGGEKGSVKGVMNPP